MIEDKRPGPARITIYQSMVFKKMEQQIYHNPGGWGLFAAFVDDHVTEKLQNGEKNRYFSPKTGVNK
ncbi:hypothetical protein [Chitinophaga alhagiae]|uniref:hypothetical protein n=1 Tax=Chitinophaga alhagiae TaxID=2203219 RepID=UPI0018E532B3|nr:hypothetical protein [Chitinophaga alhagiae]